MTDDTADPAGPLRTGGAGALAGVRVLDLTLSFGGGIATMLLADYGAEVIRVVRGDVHRARLTPEPLPWERGKRSVTADLGRADDVELLRQLATTADVVLLEDDNAELEGAGLAPDELRAKASKLVVVSITGGSDGCVDDVIAAASYGAMAASPGHSPGPTFLGHPAIANSTGLLAAIGALAGLRHRLRAGAGVATVVGRDAAVLAQRTMQWWSERHVSYLQGRTDDGDLDLGHRRMLLRRFRCADGALIQVHTGAQGAFGRFVALVGLADQISAPAEGRPETATDLTDADLAVLNRELPAIMAARPAGEWLDLLWGAQVAALPLQAPAVAYADPQVEHAGLVVEVAGPDGLPRSVVGPPISFRHQPGAAGQSIPAADHDTDVRDAGWQAAGLGAEPLRGVPQGQGASRAHRARGAGPLEGLHLLEFSSWFAAAYGNRILSDLGAEVIKVEPVHGDPIRVMPDPFHAANHGKRSIALDLKADDAAGLLASLFAWADVVQHNFRPGTAERVGIDAASARAVNHELVYSYAPGYGSSGPKSALQSFAPLLSGFVGIMHEATGGDHPPHQSFGNEDYYNGMLSAVGVLLGVIGRDRTGCADDIECPQLHSSLLATSHWFLVGGERRSVLPPIDDDETGWSPVQRIYQCLEGWLAVSCRRPGEVAALQRVVLGHDVTERGTDDELAEALTYELFGRSAAEWQRELRAAAVPCAVVDEGQWYDRYLLDDANVAAGRVAELDLPEHGRIRMVARLLDFADLALPERPGAPPLGADTDWVRRTVAGGDRASPPDDPAA